MCGIVGYVGRGDALSVIISGLEKLEYRGYDSAGVAIVEGGKVGVSRAVGKLQELKNLLASARGGKITSEAHLGIGHTRWATHGKPCEINAHPHTAGRVSLVHNGIIENYLQLREELEGEGCVFQSETDTEIAAHLLNKYLAEGGNPIEALSKVCGRIRGSYSFVAFDSDDTSRLLVAKSATPIIIGIGEGETIVASDIPAVLNHTRRILVLEDGDLAEVTTQGVTVLHDGKPVERKIETVTWDPITAQKGGFKHYMLKEIHDQPQVIAESFRGRVELENPNVFLPEVKLTDAEIKGITRIVLTACGTSWHACLVGKFFIERSARIPCEVDYASEFRYRDPVLDPSTLVIVVSQSGETADTLAAVEHAQKAGCQVLAVCNVLGSSLSRRVQHVVYTQAGPEISVASTKAFTTQLVCLYLVSILLGEKRGVLPADDISKLLDALGHLPSALSEALRDSATIEKIAKSHYAARDFLFLGRGICYPVALEGALKLKEISYIHAEGYPAGEMKHGPIALIDANMPVVCILNRSGHLVEKMISNLKEVESRDGKIIIVTDLEDKKLLSGLKADVIQVPFVSEALASILLTIPLQLLAYYVAVLNGTDVDLPRNLAKSVTVE